MVVRVPLPVVDDLAPEPRDGLRELQFLAPARPRLRLQAEVRRVLRTADVGRISDCFGYLKLDYVFVAR